MVVENLPNPSGCSELVGEMTFVWTGKGKKAKISQQCDRKSPGFKNSKKWGDVELGVGEETNLIWWLVCLISQGRSFWTVIATIVKHQWLSGSPLPLNKWFGRNSARWFCDGFWSGNHWTQWFFNGSQPLVKRWNSNDPSLWSNLNVSSSFFHSWTLLKTCRHFWWCPLHWLLWEI